MSIRGKTTSTSEAKLRNLNNSSETLCQVFHLEREACSTNGLTHVRTGLLIPDSRAARTPPSGIMPEPIRGHLWDRERSCRCP